MRWWRRSSSCEPGASPLYDAFAELDLGIDRLARPPRPPLARRDQPGPVNGLGEVVVAPRLQAPVAVARHRVGRQREYRAVVARGTQRRRRLVPVHLGHLDI